MLCGCSSMRSLGRVADVSINTVSNLLIEAGAARPIRCAKIQTDPVPIPATVFLHACSLLCPRLLGSFASAKDRTGLSHRRQQITIPARGARGEFRCDLHFSCAIRVKLVKLVKVIVHSQGLDARPNFTNQRNSSGKTPTARKRNELNPSHSTLFLTL